MADYPDNLLFTKEHEWARIDERDGKKVAVVGVTRYAVDQLGDVTLVDLPKEGEKVRKDESFGTIESVKTVSDLFSPVSGTVVRTNSPVLERPEFVNDDCYDEGWLIEIELSAPAEVELLLTGDQYAAYLQEREG
jgi:glycine cleavage system H protein